MFTPNTMLAGSAYLYRGFFFNEYWITFLEYFVISISIRGIDFWNKGGYYLAF
jgi:hypothetical protein